MARIDSILQIVSTQGANELRMGTDREPKMFAGGTAKRLSIPKTDEETLRELLGEILTPEREQQMRARGRIDTSYDAVGIGGYIVTMYARERGFDVMFMRKAGTGPAATMRTAAGLGGPARASVAPSIKEVPAQHPALELVQGVPVVETAGAEAAPIAPAAPMVAEPSLPPPILPPLQPQLQPMVPPLPHLGAHGEPRTPFAQLVAAAGLLRASDLHLADGEPPKVRVDGALRSIDRDAPHDVRTVLALDGAERERLEAQGSIDVARDVEGAGRVRVHAFRTSHGFAAAVRLLPRAAPALASLHLPVPIEDLVELPHGLVLVCGATGSGKSTTLAALAQDALRRRSIVLTTLEDPIEYALAAPEGSIVRRRQVGRDVRDFATGLRDALREDPDVLLVGEMRDAETIALALTAAETGHLVLASMHSRSAASAIERIVDSYPPERAQQIRVQLADALRAIVAQRLLPRARGGGRTPAVEVLRVTHALGAMIREGRTAQIASAMQSGRREGMITLERCLADRVAAGEVKLDDARAAANDPAALAMYLAK